MSRCYIFIYIYAYKTCYREYESSILRTVDAYIEAVRPLLTVVLLIPPVGASSFLRSSLLLRLTGEILDSITGYIPAAFDQILDILGDLDRGWVAVLRSQQWNAEEKIGEGVPSAPTLQLGGPLLQRNSISQTDRTRLRSLLSSAMDNFEEWIETVVSRRTSGDLESAAVEPARSAELIELMKVQQSFDDLFTGTLAELGELHGSLPLDLTDSENDEYELV